MKKSKIIHKRMRPALGTFVEIQVSKDEARLFEIGFNAIDEIEKEMSYFISDSDIGRFNSLSVGEEIVIGERTKSVLEISERLFEISRGVFDISLGSRNIFSLRGLKMKRLKPGKLNLGGIAKGFAVDCAVEAILKQAPKVFGIVNAGGDLRVFGSESQEIFIRVPGEKENQFHKLRAKNLSISTSSRNCHEDYFGPNNSRTATVLGTTCMMADALTKVVLMAPREVSNLALRTFNSRALCT